MQSKKDQGSRPHHVADEVSSCYSFEKSEGSVSTVERLLGAGIAKIYSRASQRPHFPQGDELRCPALDCGQFGASPPFTRGSMCE